MKRMERRWAAFTGEDIRELAARATFEEYRKCGLQGPWMPETTDALRRRTLHVLCGEDDFRFSFLADGTVAFSQNGGEETRDPVEVVCLPGEESVYLALFFIRGSDPPTAVNLVLDDRTGLCTVCRAWGGEGENPREIKRRFFFGLEEGRADPGYRHGFTEELVGRCVTWRYNEVARIRHIYLAPLYYTYSMTMGDRFWAATNPADYVKLRDELYIFSFVEERQAGTQGFFVMDLHGLHDVGSFFGFHARGMECCLVGAKGTVSSPFDRE